MRGKEIGNLDFMKEFQSLKETGIGGTNLLLNSDFSQGSEFWGRWMSGWPSENTFKDGIATIKIINNSYPESAPVANGIEYIPNFPFKYHERYVLSFDARTDEEEELYAGYIYLLSYNPEIDNQPLGKDAIDSRLSSEWKRIVVPFTIDHDIDGNLFIAVSARTSKESISYQIRNVKLERGSIATDWSPAPEDLVNKPYLEARLSQLNESSELQTSKDMQVADTQSNMGGVLRNLPNRIPACLGYAEERRAA